MLISHTKPLVMPNHQLLSIRLGIREFIFLFVWRASSNVEHGGTWRNILTIDRGCECNISIKMVSR
jgi:hypothetical protein